MDLQTWGILLEELLESAIACLLGLPRGYSVTSTPRQKATRSVISAAAGLGVG